MRLVRLIKAALVASVAMVGQEHGGAKALYLDPPPSSTAGIKQSVPSTAPARRAGAAVVTRLVQANPGILYWVELAKPNGDVQRVVASRPFYSGERVRLHFESNVEGILSIYQMQDQETTLELLFPNADVAPGANHVKAHSDTVVPPAGGWLRFDEHPGKIRLAVILSTTIGGTGDGGVLERQRVSAGERVEPTVLDRVAESRRSKRLRVEVDEKSAKPATYVVNMANPKEGRQPGGVAIEIFLQHWPAP